MCAYVCIHTYIAWVHMDMDVHACESHLTCGFWESELLYQEKVDVRNHLQLFFNFTQGGKVSLANPELRDADGLASQLTLGIPVSTFPGWNYR